MIDTATLAGGCFWCTEAIFRRLKGVTTVTPGYAGGNKENPSYYDVVTGTTGHGEAIQLTFDPSIIPYEKILDIFWHTHNPTTKDGQGADVGTEYRSMILYHSEKQKNIALKSKQEIENSGTFKDPIVTEIVPYSSFYPAEEEHMNFAEKNQSSPYCTFVINPKIQKLLKEYGNDVKDEYK